MSNVSRITGNYKIISATDSIDLPRESEEMVEVIRHEGTGNFYSFALEFNNQNIELKFVIDGKVIFDLNINTLNNITSQLQNAPYVLHVDQNNDAVIFKPSHALLFREYIAVYARAASNSNSRDFERGYVELSEE